MTQVKVLNADVMSQGNQLFWNLTVEVTRPGQEPTLEGHIFPDDVFEWRVAEYGYDPEDKEMLLQMILHEPYMNEDREHPGFLYNAPDIEAARQYKDQLLDEALQDGKAVGIRGAQPRALTDQAIMRGADEVDPLQFILDNMHIDPEYVEAKRTHVSGVRQAMAAQRQARMMVSRSSNPLDHLRRQRQPFHTPGANAPLSNEGVDS